MNIEFSGKTALVTGAAHGIGRAIVHGLAASGAHVWACDILPEVLQETVDTTQPQMGGSVHSSVTDVSDSAAISALVKKASASSGRVDILVHSAGGTIGQAGQPLETVTLDQWQAIFDVNLKGGLHLLSSRCAGHEAGPRRQNSDHFQRRRLGREPHGHTGLRLLQGGPDRVSPSAGPRVGSLRHNRQQRRAGIHSASNPTTELQWEAMGPEGQRRLMESIPVKRPGRPEDIANAVMFLVSDYAGYISGQTLSVNGGPRR